MGRPINKRNFATATVGPGSGNEIKVDFHNGTTNKTGFIVKQLGSKTFLCSELGGVNSTHKCTLRTGAAIGDLVAGQMMITVKAADNETYTVSKISGRTMTLVAIGNPGSGKNELDGKKVQWGYDAAANAADATQLAKTQIEEAGADDVAGNDEDNFANA